MQRTLGLLLIVFFFSCKTKQEAVSTPPPPVVKEEVKKDTAKKAEVKPEPIKDIPFHLTLLLSLNSQHYLEKDSVGDYVYPDMEPLNLSSLNFYEGVLLASQTGDSSIKVNVID